MVSILRSLTANNGRVLYAEDDGEFTYATVEFGYLADRQLASFALRRYAKGVDVEMHGDHVMAIAFESSRYYL